MKRRRSTLFIIAVVLLPFAIFAACFAVGYSQHRHLNTLLEGLGWLVAKTGVADWVMANADSLHAWLSFPRILLPLGFLVATIYVPPYLLVRRRRRRFIAERTPITDEEFLGRLGVAPEHREVCVAFRSAIAVEAGAPPGMVYPDDTLESVARLIVHGFEGHSVVFRMEKVLGVTIPTNLLLDEPFRGIDRKDIPDTVGGVARLMAPYVAAHVASERLESCEGVPGGAPTDGPSPGGLQERKPQV